MTRLIDADVLIEDVRQHSESYFADDFAHIWVDKQPTVEAKPIRHAYWIRHEDWEEEGGCGWECSECGKHSDDTCYCPNCGARMKGTDGE